MPDARFHDLRHTCATLLLLANENVKVVSERLSHDSIEIALHTYSHVLSSMQKRAAEKIDRIFGQMNLKKIAERDWLQCRSWPGTLAKNPEPQAIAAATLLRMKAVGFEPTTNGLKVRCSTS